MNEPLELVANLEGYRISPGSIFSTYYIAGNRCGQLIMTNQGDTASAWLGRVVASFWGCLIGMVLW